ncbi:MAG TPA: ABC transporter ATP-binding protein [Reyranella sp.]
MTAAPAIELLGIQKSFGSVQAVRGVSLAIAKGAITGIVGENGAGKSTLMSILYGLYHADAGEVRIDGQPMRMDNPHDAIAHGIGMVHQHFMLVDTFTVLENLVLGAEGGPLLAGGLAAARAELERLAREYGLSVNPDAKIADLSVGEQQRVEILKVLFRGARILILDEPSAVLTPQETDQLFRILATLKERGVTIVLITHKLREIMAATDHVYVMRQGQIVADRRTADTNPEELAELMVGRKVRLQLDKSAAKSGEVLLSAEKLSLVDHRGVRLLDNVDLELRAGEIVGIAGVSGNGQTELLQILSGIRRPTSGTLTVRGRMIDAHHPSDPAEMRALGVAHVPEDRLRQGMVAAFQASETAILGYQAEAPFCRNYLLDQPAVGRHCATLMDRFDVRPRAPTLRSSNFSGGNQQKLVLAREMEREPKVLLVGQPTRGVDIGAIEFIHRELVKSRDKGCAVLVVSVELDEILSLADRILVMFAGRIMGEVPAGRADERTLGMMMAGAHSQGAGA